MQTHIQGARLDSDASITTKIYSSRQFTRLNFHSGCVVLTLAGISTSGRSLARDPGKMRHAPPCLTPPRTPQTPARETKNPPIQRLAGDALLFSDLAENRKLAAWLLDYNKSCPILVSASKRHYNSSFNINPSAICGGLI